MTSRDFVPRGILVPMNMANTRFGSLQLAKLMNTIPQIQILWQALRVMAALLQAASTNLEAAIGVVDVVGFTEAMEEHSTTRVGEEEERNSHQIGRTLTRIIQ
jgi:hypothetical protein